jgi:hypothetical protein
MRHTVRRLARTDRGGSVIGTNDKVNLAEKLAQFTDHFAPLLSRLLLHYEGE